MELHPKANQIRKLHFSNDRRQDIEIKQEMLDVLKEKLGYQKNLDAVKAKRERRAKIREEANDDPDRIETLKERQYTSKEKRQSNLCPYPHHKQYLEVWKSLAPSYQKEMKENIRVTDDGKIEIIKLRKKFSFLTGIPNGKDIIKSSTPGMICMNKGSAERECKAQSKKLFKNREEVNFFLDLFPGEDTEDRISNFVKLFDLDKLFPEGRGTVILGSEKDGEWVFGVSWKSGGTAESCQIHGQFGQFFIASEAC